MPDSTRTQRPAAAHLQAAADLIRQTAGAATPGPWKTHDTSLDTGAHTATVLTKSKKPTGPSELIAWLPTFSHEPWNDNTNAWANSTHIALWNPEVACAVADHLDAIANTMAWLAPYRPHETGHPIWESAHNLTNTLREEPR